ncbi:MAG: hypothetical protein AAF362_11425 [Pseudomonadota bacterium]
MLIFRQLFLACAIGVAALIVSAAAASAGVLANPIGTTALAQAADQFVGGDNSDLQEVRHGKRRARRHSKRGYRGKKGRNYRKYSGKRYRKKAKRRHYRHSGKRYRKHKRRRYSRRHYYPDFYFGPAYPPTVYIVPVPQYHADACSYWARQCEKNWRTRSDFIGCMRYQGCY